MMRRLREALDSTILIGMMVYIGLWGQSVWADAGTSEDLPDIGESQLEVFELDRGWYVSSDLGTFVTFGGSAAVSNVQPYLAVKFGYDVLDYLSLQMTVAMGFSSGSAASAYDLPHPNNDRIIANYGLTNFSGVVVGALRPTERFAIEPWAGGGMTLISPGISSVSTQGVDLLTVAPHLTAGVDLKYLTLLTDFTAGISLSYTHILGPSIHGLGAGVVVRYTL